MKQLLTIIMLLLCAPCAAQEAQPDDMLKPYLTIFTHADWEKRSDERSLVEAIQQGNMLKLVKDSHFNHYTPDDEMYKQRWAEMFPESKFPVIVTQVPSGGITYKASRGNIPSGSEALFNDIAAYQGLLPIKNPTMEQAEPEYVLLDSIETWGNAPIRSSIGSSLQIMNAVMAIGFLLAIAAVAAVVLKIIG